MYIILILKIQIVFWTLPFPIVSILILRFILFQFSPLIYLCYQPQYPFCFFYNTIYTLFKLSPFLYMFTCSFFLFKISSASITSFHDEFPLSTAALTSSFHPSLFCFFLYTSHSHVILLPIIHPPPSSSARTLLSSSSCTILLSRVLE